MARTKHLDPPTRVLTTIPQSIHTALSLLMFSPIEGRVPHGAWNRIITRWASEELCKPEQDRQLAEAIRTGNAPFLVAEHLSLTGFPTAALALLQRHGISSPSSEPSLFSSPDPTFHPTSIGGQASDSRLNASLLSSPNTTDTSS